MASLGIWFWSAARRTLTILMIVLIGIPIAVVLAVALLVFYQISVGEYYKETGEIVLRLLPQLGIVAIGMLPITSLFLWGRLFADQCKRNAVVQRTVAELRAGRKLSEPLILFLRSFEWDDKFGEATPQTREFTGMRRWTQRFEGLLYSAILGAFGKPMACALGKFRGAYGFGRVRTRDDKWEETVRLLLDKAMLVIMMFSDTPGTARELDHVLQGDLLDRTVFVVPPKDSVRSDSNLERYYLDRDFQTFAVLMRGAGYDVPEYRQAMLFRLDRETKQSDWVVADFRSGQDDNLQRWLFDVAGPEVAESLRIAARVRRRRKQIARLLLTGLFVSLTLMIVGAAANLDASLRLLPVWWLDAFVQFPNITIIASLLACTAMVILLAWSTTGLARFIAMAGNRAWAIQ